MYLQGFITCRVAYDYEDMTTLAISQEALHFEENKISADQIVFSAYGHLSVSSGTTRAEWENSDIIAGSKEQHQFLEGKGDQAPFRQITGFCQNETHFIVVDSNNHCIRSIDRMSNQSRTIAGKCGTGQADYRNGTGLISRFNYPQSIIRVRKKEGGHIYAVTDHCNNAIRLIDEGDQNVSTWIDNSDSSYVYRPIDLIMHQQKQSVYVTTLHSDYSLVLIDILSKSVTLFAKAEFGSPFKISAFGRYTYVVSYKNSNRLGILNTNGSTSWIAPTICNGNYTSADGNINNCSMNTPLSVYWSKSNSVILIGTEDSIRKLPATLPGE